jgi:hypothetical protein
MHYEEGRSMKRSWQLRPWSSCNAVVMDNGFWRVLGALVFELVVPSCLQNAQSQPFAGAEA